MSDDLTLFDLAAPQPPPAASRSDRGRAGYRYARSVTAEVTVQRIPVLLDAAVQAFDGGTMIDIGEVDADDEVPDTREQIGSDPATALGWLLDPTDGMWPLLETGSATVLEVDIGTAEVSPAGIRCVGR